jgi:membrane protein required for colicin V production
MRTIDILLLLVIGAGAAKGYLKGGVKLLLSTVGLIVGLYIAKLMYIPFAETLCPSFTKSMTFARALAFIIIWVAVPLLSTLAGGFFTKTLEAMHINWLNKWAGALLGGLKYLILASLFINVLEFIDSSNHLISQDNKKEAILYYPTQKVAGIVFPLVKEVSNKYIH